MSIVKEGWVFIITPVTIGLSITFLGRLWVYPGYTLIILGLFCAFFFRDPVREIPDEVGVILSPGDGTIMEVVEEDRDLFERLGGFCAKSG